MPNFNIDDVLNQFGEKSKIANKSNLDVDDILSQFNSSETERPSTDKPRVIIDTNKPQPFTEEETKEALKPKINPRELLPHTNIKEAAYEADVNGKALASEGAEDFATGHPYKGIGKFALGSISRLMSPITGIVEGGIVTPIADITGNKDIANRAGFIASAAVPLDMGIGKITKAIPKNKAMSTLVENIGAENLPAVVSAMKANPRLAPVDLSPRVLQDAQHLFANEGPQINYLANTSANRMADRKDVMTNAYDASGGVSKDLAQKMTELSNNSKKVGSEKINPAVAGAEPVNVSPVIEYINRTLKPGVMNKISEDSTLALPEVKSVLTRAKELLTNGTETRTGAQDLHDIQKSLRRQSYNLMKSGNAGEREVGNALLGVRNKIVEAIDEASPKIDGKGSYKPALEGYRDEMHIADAFKKGHDDIFISSKKIENDPSFVKKWYNGLTDAEKQAATEGARAAIHTEMGVAKNPALAGESIARSDFNKSKMEVLFGKEETEKLLNKLAVERAITNTHNKIIEGSQTAMRTASKSQFALPDKTEIMKSVPAIAAAEASNFFMGGAAGVGTGLFTAAKVGAVAKDAIKMKLAREHNARYAQYALPTEGPSRDELIRQLEARIPGPKQSLLARGADTVSRLVGP